MICEEAQAEHGAGGAASIGAPTLGPALRHAFPFDPSYGHTLDSLLKIAAPAEPENFTSFWMRRRAQVDDTPPRTKLRHSDLKHADYEVLNISFRGLDGRKLRGWLTVPRHTPVRRALIIGHGYSGLFGPDFHPVLRDAVCLFPCARGLGRSSGPPYSENPDFHVIHDIQDPERYVIGLCVEDFWMAVSALLSLYPFVNGRIGCMGISFSGGISALALPWEPRIQRAHLRVPTFGNHPLRLSLPTIGSTRSLAASVARNPRFMEHLPLFDAAVAARHIRIPMHIAAAIFDPAVAPPGQFSIYNELAGEKRLFPLRVGHFDHPDQEVEDLRLRAELERFFDPL